MTPPATSDQPAAATSHNAEHAAKLKRMATGIAAFFKAYPDDQAAASIADHINQFWNRRMREDFLATFGAAPETLPPLVRRALPLIHRGRES
ncbi:MAG: formate dehydrogenase [Chelatococcus sp.]|nr:MAG: formate dehydrogenase [Chelatococcus sp.]